MTTNVPADARTPYGNRDLPGKQPLALLDALQARFGAVDPEVVLRVGVDADVGLGSLDLGRRVAIHS